MWVNSITIYGYTIQTLWASHLKLVYFLYFLSDATNFITNDETTESWHVRFIVSLESPHTVRWIHYFESTSCSSPFPFIYKDCPVVEDEVKERTLHNGILACAQRECQTYFDSTFTARGGTTDLYPWHKSISIYLCAPYLPFLARDSECIRHRQ